VYGINVNGINATSSNTSATNGNVEKTNTCINVNVNTRCS
jgi:hypothetical protein